ncbi:PIN domain-containing protein [Candidatus Woesearchaeota archaeon]|nr:PIN domain-containing protein [Candidatus Woesearchaeota archaeon]
MTASRLIDTSIWLDYFYRSKFKEIIDTSEILFVSILSVFEIRRKLYKDKIDPDKAAAIMEFLQKKSLIQPLSREIAEAAAKISVYHGIPATVSLIYATAQHHQAELITRDNDFHGLENATILH